MSSAPRIFQLKTRLLGISPMIWRRVLVSSSTTLHELHGILQVAMGWDQANRASEAFDECSQEVIAPSCLFELHAV